MNRIQRALVIVVLILPAAVYAQDMQSQDIPEEIVQRVDPSVVAIQHERGGGSGFIVTADGYILSNGHVVRGEDKEYPMEPARSITVILHDERKFPARVIGFCMDPDVAVLKIESPEPLAPVVFGDSRNAQIGQRVFAVGTPHGLKRTFSGGILSNVDRTDLNTFTTVIQTDAAINPGNSGGPLFDRNGKVLGVNTYGTRGANNLGFTIPIHVVERLYHDIREHGRFMRADVPFFVVRELYDELREALGVEHGVLVEYVMENTPAEKAGLLAGDVIIEQNGQPVSARTRSDLSDFTWAFTTLEPGTQIAWTVLRADDNGYARVGLQAVLEEAEPMIATGRTPGEIVTEKYDALGLSFSRIVHQHRIEYRLQDDPGVLVVESDRATPATRAELRKNDIITDVGGVPVHDVASFRDALEARFSEREKYIDLMVRRGQQVWRTALAPHYDLDGQRVVVIVPPGETRDLDLVLRELISQGAELIVASPTGSVALTSKVPQKQVTLQDVDADEIDILLLLDGEMADTYWHDAIVLELVRQVHANEKMLAAIGASTITLLAAEPELREKKMTTSKVRSSEAIQRKAQYTGSDVEKDANILTATGFDRQVVREFLKQLGRSS